MRLRFALLSAVAFMALSAPAYADEFWGDDIEVMAEAEMQHLRGGINVGGVNINFGAIITTAVNGAPVLTTQLTWTDAGAIVSQTMAGVGQTIADLTPDERTALGIDGLDGAGGIVIEDERGVTALVHNVTNGALQNIIVNTATGRDVTQDIDVTLTLPGFEFIQGNLALERLGIQVDGDLRGFLF